MREKARAFCWALLGLWALTGGLDRWAEAQYYRRGDILITRSSTPVMDEDRVMSTIPGGSRLVATEIRWPWVLVAVKPKELHEADICCAECGEKDFTREKKHAIRLFDTEVVFKDPNWIRGWVHVQYLYREADCGESRVTFDNQSGQGAKVRLVGPTDREVYVPDGQSRTIYPVRAGHYYILVRYDDGRCRAGEHFNVEATGTTFSRVTITLHGVVGGNYPTSTIPEEVFNCWGKSE